MRQAMAPGEGLDHMMRMFLSSASDVLDSGKVVEGNSQCFFDLFRKVITRASTDAVFGLDKNPFQNPEIEKSYW